MGTYRHSTKSITGSLLLALVLVLSQAGYVYAETLTMKDLETKAPEKGTGKFVAVTFKNGGTIKGELMRKTDSGGLVVGLGGGNITISKGEIGDVKTLSSQETAAYKEMLGKMAEVGGVRAEEGTYSQYPEGRPKMYVKKVQWFDTIEDGITQAKRDNKIVLVDFSTEWCGWCKKLERTFQNSKVQEVLKSDFACVHIDGDKRKDLTKEYAVSGYPTLVFLTQDGTFILKASGYLPPSEFINSLNQVKQEAKNIANK